MKLAMKSVMKFAGVMAAAVAAPLAHASFALTNGDFESGDAPWSPTPSTVTSIVSGGNPSGTSGHSLQFKSTSGLNALFAGSAGQAGTVQLGDDGTYLFQYWINGRVADGFGIDFLDALSNSVFTSLLVPGTTVSGWTPYSATVALDGDFTLEFFAASANEAAFDFRIDDVSLTLCTTQDCSNSSGGGNLPEPGSLLLVGAALAGLGLIRRRKNG